MIDAAEHLGLARLVVNRTLSRWATLMDRDDAEGWAMLGLVKAARSYDPARGLAFSTYAAFRIRGELIDAIRREARCLRRDHVQISLDTPIGPNGRTLGEMIAADGDGIGDAEVAADGAASVWSRWAATLRPRLSESRVRARARRCDTKAERQLRNLLAARGWRREAVG